MSRTGRSAPAGRDDRCLDRRRPGGPGQNRPAVKLAVRRQHGPPAERRDRRTGDTSEPAAMHRVAEASRTQVTAQAVRTSSATIAKIRRRRPQCPA
jgi:hypothetical protein